MLRTTVGLAMLWNRLLIVDFPVPPRSLTYLKGLALVLGLQIDSGNFSALPVVRNHTPPLRCHFRTASSRSLGMDR